MTQQEIERHILWLKGRNSQLEERVATLEKHSYLPAHRVLKGKDEEIAALQIKLDICLNVLRQCNNTFSRYASIHASKTPPDMEKSNANLALAELCRDAVNSVESPSSSEAGA